MKKVSILFSAMIVAILVLSACNAGGQTPTSTGGGQATSAAPVGTMAVSTAAPAPAQPTAVPAVPSGMMSLSTIYTFQITDANGKALGSIDDFILDFCNAKILGVIMKPDASLNLKSSLLIPYEAFKFPSTEDSLVLSADPAQLTNAPTVDPATLDLNNPAPWVETVGGYWAKLVQLNPIQECKASTGAGATAAGTTAAGATLPVPAETSSTAPTPAGLSASTPEATLAAGAGSASTPQATGSASLPGGSQNFKLAFGKNALFTSLLDQSGATVGKVNSIIVSPATGALVYFIIQPSQLGKKLITVPAAAVTVQNQAGGTPNLVLTTTNAIFLSAPVFDVKTDITKSQWDTQVTNYWSQQMGGPQATP